MLHWSGPGEIVDGIFLFAELLEDGLFLRKGLAGIFVGLVGRQPDLVAKCDRIVIEREQGVAANAGVVITVLFVVTQANDHAKKADVDALIIAGSSEGGLGRVVFNIADAIFDVVGS